MNKAFFFLISGGPDSMYSFHSLYDKLKNHGDIFVLHFNHKTRSQTSFEAEFLKKYFSNIEKVKFISGENKYTYKFTEQCLRKVRRDWVWHIVKQYENKYNNIYIITGHNLTDRIETTILNMLRGSHLKGFINMRQFEKKHKKIYIWRPLLKTPKYEIEKKCIEEKIPYFVDNTNFDEKVSKRNIVRKIIYQLDYLSNKDKSGNSLFWQSWQNLYDILEASQLYIKSKIEIKPVYKSFWNKLNVNFIKEINFGVNLKDISFEQVVEMLDILGIYKNIDTNLLKELHKFITKGSGKKHFQNIWFFKTVGRLFIMDKLPKEGFSGNIIEKKKNKTIRYPYKGEKVNGKSFTKYLAKRGIPNFLRGWIEVEI